MRVVFTNTGNEIALVAPTGYKSLKAPFILMMLTGLLLAGFAVPGCLRKRRRAREDLGTEEQIRDPEIPQPGPRPKLLIQPRGPSGKPGWFRMNRGIRSRERPRPRGEPRDGFSGTLRDGTKAGSRGDPG
jgi:hypothetical protein